jgi:hypothetical protein
VLTDSENCTVCDLPDLQGAVAATEVNPEGTENDANVTDRGEVSKNLSRPSAQDLPVTAGHESSQPLPGRHAVGGKCSIQKENL